MSTTIETFMNFAKPAKEEKLFIIEHTIQDIMKIIGGQLANHGIIININFKDNDIKIFGYEDLLEQVIINLLSNAKDAFIEQHIIDRIIDIDVYKKNDIAIIQMKDNAGGIPKDVEEKIFNPYFTTKEQGKGTGIGLYMSLDIMKKTFNGDLVYSKIDGGSCFHIICGRVDDK